MALILVIDDEPDVLDSICEILQWGGYKTLKAQDGEKGLEMAAKNLPDTDTSNMLETIDRSCEEILDTVENSLKETEKRGNRQFFFVDFSFFIFYNYST